MTYFVITELITEKIAFEDGTPGGSSYYNDKARPAAAFSQEKKHQYWLSGETKGQSDPLPFFVWYKFKSPIGNPIKMSFKPRPENLNNAKKQTPKSFQFIGSNDNNCTGSSDWSVLCDGFYDDPVESVEEVRGCQVQKGVALSDHHVMYRCLGIKILALHSGTAASLCNLMMWSVR